MRIVIASLPWALVNFPSQAAAVIAAAVPEHDATVYYGNIDWSEFALAEGVDLGAVRSLSNEATASLLGDWVFTSALYGRPHNVEAARAQLAALLPDPEAGMTLHRLAPQWADRAAAAIVAEQPRVVGFTTTFQQNVASLAVAARIKQLAPDTVIVFGGSNCDGEMGAALHRNYSQLDYVIQGEGEEPFRQLVAAVGAGQEDEATLRRIPSLYYRRADGTTAATPFSPLLATGREFPAADHSGYFATLEASPLAEYVSPSLVLESARGCWWGQKKHCTFCGLNDLTIAYRSREAPAVLQDFLEGAAKHQVLDVVTTDNIIERQYYAELLPALAAAGHDFRIFYEMKANITLRHAQLLAAAGVTKVQPGIENLHSAPLRLMNKGITGTQTLAALRDLTGVSVSVFWNYLYGFPGETDEHYDSIVDQMPNLVHLQPPSGASRIRLQRFNPYFVDPAKGFPTRAAAAPYHLIYDLPAAEVEGLAFDFDSNDAGLVRGGEAETRLERGIAAWLADYPTSSLAHREVDGAFWVYDRRATRAHTDWELTGYEAAVYRLLERGSSVERLAGWLAAAGEDGSVERAGAAVGQLLAAGLLFEESETYVRISTPLDVGLVRMPPEFDSMLEAVA